MKFRTVVTLGCWLTLVAPQALAQGLSSEEILEQLGGRWGQQGQAPSCDAAAVTIKLSHDKLSATVENWPAGKTTAYEARRVQSIMRVGQQKSAGAVSLIDMTAAPPVFLSIGMGDANTFSLSSALESADAPVVFVRCPA